MSKDNKKAKSELLIKTLGRLCDAFHNGLAEIERQNIDILNKDVSELLASFICTVVCRSPAEHEPETCLNELVQEPNAKMVIDGVCQILTNGVLLNNTRVKQVEWGPQTTN